MMKQAARKETRAGRTGLWIGGGVFAFALLVRLLHLWGMSSHPTFDTPIVDCGRYHQIAMELARTKTLTVESFWQVFLYPYVLAGIYQVFGPSIIAAKAAQAVLGAAVCVLTWRLGRKLFDQRTGILAGAALALYGPLIFFEGEILATGMAAFFAVLLLLLLTAVRIESRSLLYPALGLCGGLAVLTRVTFLPFCLAAGFWVVYTLRMGSMAWSGIAARAGALAIAFLLVTGLVAFKNREVTGRFSFLPETGPLNLYMGNNPDSPDIMALRPGSAWDGLMNMPVRAGVRTRSEARQFFMDRFYDYVIERPLHFLGRLARKAVHLSTSREIPSNLDPYDLRAYSPVLLVLMWKVDGFGFPLGCVLPLALLGILVHRRRIPLPVHLFLVFYALAILLVFVTARYRAPMVPALVVLACAGFLHGVDTVRERRFGRAAALAAGACALAVLFSLGGPFAAEKVNYPAEMHFCLGVEKGNQGRLEEARADFEEALRLDPDYGDAHGQLGYVLQRLGATEEAMRHLRRAVALNPDLESAHYNLGELLYRKGEADEAIGHFQEAARINPINAEIQRILGSALARQGRLDEAVRHFQRTLVLRPRNYVARCSLGASLHELGRNEEAMKELRAALTDAERAKDREQAQKITVLIRLVERARRTRGGQ